MNATELRAAIARAGVTNRKIAEAIGISEQALSNKLKGTVEFKGSEIKKLADILRLNLDAINLIFFENEVN